VLFACANVAPRGNNWSRWCNPEYERWTTVALTHYDRATRRMAYARIQRLILDQVPGIVTSWQVDAEAISTDLRGFRDRDTWARPYRWSI
jgi:ABC-type transport system substrate-binding protein